MNRRLLTALLCSTGILAVEYATPVNAQSAAQATASASRGLEEIVVTARRREEKLQSVPLAITAFNAAEVEQRHIQELRDLALNVPSLNVVQAQSDPNQI